ncbi:MAG: ThuA domain-containing protein [Chthonomonadaceae bacterium]|nr:ThuA domain-containing protein [Chthonomonadaceae bacterium]
MKSALIVYGGWDGHEPEAVAHHLADLLKLEQISADLSDSLSSFSDSDRLTQYDLIVPVWTKGDIAEEWVQNVCRAVAEHGVGIGGCHGGMCDAFRDCVPWHYLTGGQWVAHPGNDGVRYKVKVTKDHPVTRGVTDFEVVSEQYYMHVDPSNDVLATCEFPNPTVTSESVSPCEMPVVWTRMYGKGRVFYFSVGHNKAALTGDAPATLLRQGFAWAARG